MINFSFSLLGERHGDRTCDSGGRELLQLLAGDLDPEAPKKHFANLRSTTRNSQAIRDASVGSFYEFIKDGWNFSFVFL